jgi:hypothetical protein
MRSVLYESMLRRAHPYLSDFKADHYFDGEAQQRAESLTLPAAQFTRAAKAPVFYG